MVNVTILMLWAPNEVKLKLAVFQRVKGVLKLCLQSMQINLGIDVDNRDENVEEEN